MLEQFQQCGSDLIWSARALRFECTQLRIKLFCVVMRTLITFIYVSQQMLQLWIRKRRNWNQIGEFKTQIAMVNTGNWLFVLDFFLDFLSMELQRCPAHIEYVLKSTTLIFLFNIFLTVLSTVLEFVIKTNGRKMSYYKLLIGEMKKTNERTVYLKLCFHTLFLGQFTYYS